MTFHEIADSIGITTYPPAMDACYNANDSAPACDMKLIDSLQQEYYLFGLFYDTVRECALQLNADPARSAWVKTAAVFAKQSDHAVAGAIPVPPADGTQLTAMLPLFILAAQAPDALAEYRRRGFSEEEVQLLARIYRSSLTAVKSRTGMVGINQLFFRWTTHFTKVRLFNVGGLQFELRALPDRAVYLRHLKTGEILPLVCNCTHHRSGVQPIGSAGYDDEEGAFTCTFYEDDANFYGHGAPNAIVLPTLAAYSKSEWECLVRPGDPCLGMHIPPGADIGVETVESAVLEARRIVRERFADFGGDRVYCSSWLLDPTLETILGADSKIVRFQKQYVRIPEISGGGHVFGTVFPAQCESYADLPEDTRLQRGLKKLYLDGGYIHAYAGVIF